MRAASVSGLRRSIPVGAAIPRGRGRVPRVVARLTPVDTSAHIGETDRTCATEAAQPPPVGIENRRNRSSHQTPEGEMSIRMNAEFFRKSEGATASASQPRNGSIPPERRNRAANSEQNILPFSFP
jgi:hypothetical protein